MNSTDKHQDYITYKEGKDFHVELIHEWWNIYFYFRSESWSLIWYIKAYFEEIRDGKWFVRRAKIVDTVSAYKLEQNAPEILDLFQKKWYNWVWLPDFWTTMYEVVFRYFQEKYWNDISIDIDAYERNREQIMNLIKKVQERTQWLIKNYRWWDDWNAAKIYLCQNL